MIARATGLVKRVIVALIEIRLKLIGTMAFISPRFSNKSHGVIPLVWALIDR